MATTPDRAPGAAPSAGTPAQPFRPPNMALATISIALAMFMQVLDITIANVSLPTISGNLGASANQAVWVITSFAVSNAIALPLTGFRSEEHTSELQTLMRTSYAVFSLKKKS